MTGGFMEPLLVSSILFVVLMVIWVFAHFLANLLPRWIIEDGCRIGGSEHKSQQMTLPRITTENLAMLFGDGVVNARGNICLSMIQPFGVRKRVSNWYVEEKPSTTEAGARQVQCAPTLGEFWKTGASLNKDRDSYQWCKYFRAYIVQPPGLSPGGIF